MVVYTLFICEIVINRHVRAAVLLAQLKKPHKKQKKKTTGYKRKVVLELGRAVYLSRAGSSLGGVGCGVRKCAYVPVEICFVNVGMAMVSD